MSIHLTKAEHKAMRNAELFTNSDAMYELAPSLFATEPHPKMSQQYAFTNTYDIVLHMHNKGYLVTSIMGGEHKYKKMLIRMRHKDHRGYKDAPEIIIIDSHDGTARLKMCLGHIRGACLNGMVVGDLFYSRAFTHRAEDLMAAVMLELLDIDTHIERLNKRVETMRNYTLSIGEKIQLANAAITERWGKDKDANFIASMRHRLLAPRRIADNDNDLYTVMNVIQENVLRGGMTYLTNTNRVSTVQPISDVRRSTNINQMLWNTAEELCVREAA